MAFLSTFYLHCYVYPSDLHSFPTRRSSDLIDETLEIVKGYDAETLDVITQINTHSYNGSQLQALNTFAKENGKTLWMSEFGAGGTEEHNHQDMTSAMELADRIIKDLRRLQPAAWVYWQAVEDEGAKNNWGFIHSDFKAGESYEITKQYYAMAHFSKFIRPGRDRKSTRLN